MKRERTEDAESAAAPVDATTKEVPIDACHNRFLKKKAKKERQMLKKKAAAAAAGGSDGAELAGKKGGESSSKASKKALVAAARAAEATAKAAEAAADEAAEAAPVAADDMGAAAAAAGGAGGEGGEGGANAGKSKKKKRKKRKVVKGFVPWKKNVAVAVEAGGGKGMTKEALRQAVLSVHGADFVAENSGEYEGQLNAMLKKGKIVVLDGNKIKLVRTLDPRALMRIQEERAAGLV